MDILLYFAITVTAIFVIKMILMMFGIGSDSDVDIEISDVPDISVDLDTDFDVGGAVDAIGGIDGDIDFDVAAGDGFDISTVSSDGHMQIDTSSDFSFILFTLDSILAFFMVFSWTVLFLVQELYLNMLLSIAIGFALGFIVMFLYSYLLSKIRNLETEEVQDAYPELDAEGVMYLSSKNGRGQAKFSVNGKYIIYDVHTNAEQIQTGEIVVVQNINNKIITVLAKNDKKN